MPFVNIFIEKTVKFLTKINIKVDYGSILEYNKHYIAAKITPHNLWEE